MIGDAYIAGPAYAGSPVTIETLGEFAGAIVSLTWKGVEFIDHYDHGRELQTSVHYGPIIEEDEAGTQAGAQSQLLAFVHKRNVVITRIRPALYYGGGPSPDTVVAKRVQVGWDGFKNVIDYQTSVKVTSLHAQIQVEAPTGYMPAGFDKFFSYLDGQLRVIPAPNLCCAYSARPLIIANTAQNVAMGIVAAKRPSIYSVGFFNGVSKWSVTYARGQTRPGVYSYDVKIAVGRFSMVEATMRRLEHKLGVGAASRPATMTGRAAGRGASAASGSAPGRAAQAAAGRGVSAASGSAPGRGAQSAGWHGASAASGSAHHR
jgi:hypothetical protein